MLDKPYPRNRNNELVLSSETEYIYAENLAKMIKNYMKHSIPDPDQSKYPGIKNFIYSPACLSHMCSFYHCFYETKQGKYNYSQKDFLALFLK